MPKTKFEISSGGVIYKREKGRVYVALISLKGGKVWALPKGVVERGESLESAALREVKEETGLEGRIVEKLGKIDYWFFWKENDERVRHHKIVYFYLMEFTGGKLEDHDYEVEEVKWFPIDEAIEVATYKDEKRIISNAKKILEEG
jgi:8-oxo-dGTP diphosphatase